MDKKSLNFNIESEKVLSSFDKTFKHNIILSGYLDYLEKTLTYKKYLILTEEKFFGSVASKVINIIKNLGLEVDCVSINDVENLNILEEVFCQNVDSVIVIGNKNFILGARYYLENKDFSLFAIITDSDFIGVLNESCYLNIDGYKKINFTKPFTLIIDENLILKQDIQTFANSYINILNTMVGIIDYKLRILLGKENFNEQAYKEIKKVIILTTLKDKFIDQKQVIAYSSFVIALYQGAYNIGINSGSDSLLISLKSVLNINEKDLNYIAFEKTILLYHAYLTNNFENIVYVPNYNKDIYELTKITNEDVINFYDNIKVPTYKRLKLLNTLINKTSGSFIYETSFAIKNFNAFKEAYLKLTLKKQIKESFSYNSIKKAVDLSIYFSKEETIFKLIKDSGILDIK